jgi:CBS domain containing-hemolysin-like protein
MEVLIFAVLLVLFCSGLCSGVEAALLSVPLVKVKKLAETKKSPALALLLIRERINRPITTIVTLNNISNIGGSIFVGGVATSVLGNQWLGTFTGILTFLIIVFGEIIPKTIGENHALRISLITAKPILHLTTILTPLVWCVELITYPFIAKKKKKTTNESEIKFLAKIGHKEGMIENSESEMIHKIFDFNDITAAGIMTPRVAMTYVNGTKKLSTVKDIVMNSQHSRIIVIKDSPDDIVGIALKSELLLAMINGESNKLVSAFMQDVNFVTESTRTDSLLKNFQKNNQHLTVVVDEYGGVSGIVTLEDVLEILTGEIIDETDKVADLQEFARKQHKNNFKKKDFFNH